MKLSKKEAQKIADNYGLGKVVNAKYLSKGWVNRNFKLKTDKGDYVIQILSGEAGKWKKEKMNVQFKLSNFLRRKNFPYEIPFPIRNKNKDYLMKFKSKFLWVYPYILGDIRKKLSKKEFKEFIKAMAIFHKSVSGFKVKPHTDYSNFDWILEKYKDLGSKKIKNKLDKLFVENSEFCISLLNELSKIDYGKKIFIHSDFNINNILFKEGKVIGILDFDNLDYAPKIRDLSTGMARINYLGQGWNRKKQKAFVETYRKFNTLSKREENLILPTLLKDRLTSFWWFYNGMEKNREKAHPSMSKNLKEIKMFYEEWKK